MKRAWVTGALLALILTATACSFSVFEDIGSDPHPPTAEMIALAIYVEPVETPPATPPAADRHATSAPGRVITWNSGGFSVTEAQLFQLGFRYTDAGGDIVKFRLRDRTGPLNLEFTPTDGTYFPGTSGLLSGPADGIGLSGILGPHELEFWAEDSHGSRSEKVQFTITLVL